MRSQPKREIRNPNVENLNKFKIRKSKKIKKIKTSAAGKTAVMRRQQILTAQHVIQFPLLPSSLPPFLRSSMLTTHHQALSHPSGDTRLGPSALWRGGGV
jgi:protoporphyrinogen oxidase